MKPRVVLADDHAALLEELCRLLTPHFEIVGTAEDGETLLEVVKATNPDAVVLDISMPRMNGITAAKRLARDHAAVKVVFLSMHQDSMLVKQALSTGAAGYVLKISAHADLVTALQAALAGEFISRSVEKKLE